MGRGCDDIGVGYRALVLPTGDKPCNVRHIDHQHGAVAMGNLGKLFKINGARVGGCTGDQQLGTYLGNLLGKGGIINATILGRNAVRHKVVVFAAHIDRGTVGQVSALGKVHAHHGVAQIQQGKIDRQVGLCAGMGLHIGVFCPKESAGAVDGDLLNLVHKLAAAVIAVTGVALCVFVGQHTAHRRHNGRGNDVLAGDQLNVLALTGQLATHSSAQFGVGFLHKANGVDQIFIHFRNLLCSRAAHPWAGASVLRAVHNCRFTALKCTTFLL